jgi:SAM-dependent methyltransferase
LNRLFNKITPPIISDLLSVIRKKIKPVKYQEPCVNDLCKYISLKSKDLLIVGLGKGIEVPIFIFKGCNKVEAVEPYPIIDENIFGSQFRLIKSNAESMPIMNNTYDVVYSVATLEHIHDPYAAVKEMIRVLKPGGIFYCNAGPLWYSHYGYHAKKEWPALYEPWFHLIYSKEEYIKKRKDILHNDEYARRISRIYDSPQYNRLPSHIYYEIVSNLILDHIPLKISFNFGSESFLNDAFKNKLIKYDLRDLITESFTIVLRKIK